MKRNIVLESVPSPAVPRLDETGDVGLYVCPDCKTPLERLYCRKCSREYAQRDGIPILLSNDPALQPVFEILKSYDSIYREHTNAWENQGRTPAFIDYFSSLLRRFATPEEVAAMVVYVSSPWASATNGSALRVDGGVVRSIV